MYWFKQKPTGQDDLRNPYEVWTWSGSEARCEAKCQAHVLQYHARLQTMRPTSRSLVTPPPTLISQVDARPNNASRPLPIVTIHARASGSALYEGACRFNALDQQVATQLLGPHERPLSQMAGRCIDQGSYSCSRTFQNFITAKTDPVARAR